MRRYFPVLILVFSVASLLIYLLGDSGLVAYEGLASFRQQLTANVTNLESRHAELLARLQAIRSDPETAKVMARSQGMYEPGDAVVKLEGRSSPPELNVVGDLLRYHAPPPNRNAFIKSLAAGAAITLLAGALLRARRERKRANASPGP